MNRSPERAINYVENYMRKNNVTVICGEKIVAQTGTYFFTDRGTVIEADLAFVCTGNVPNSELLKHEFPNHITPYGFVKVTKQLIFELLI